MSQDQQRHQHLSMKLIFRKGVQTVINTYLVTFQGYQHTIATSSIHWNRIFVAVKDDFIKCLLGCCLEYIIHLFFVHIKPWAWVTELDR